MINNVRRNWKSKRRNISDNYRKCSDYFQFKMILRKRKIIMYTGVSVLISVLLMNTLSMTLYGYSHRPVQVLILTYMRSGSSLTGDILQHSQGSFYVYEPLRFLCPSNCTEAGLRHLQYPNGSNRYVSFKIESASLLYNWFSCNISRIPSFGLLDVFMDNGSKTKLFSPCYQTAIKETMDHSFAMEKCARQLQEICERSPIRVIKTIRARLENVKSLLGDIPNLKIIHVVRDPRATLFSQSHFHMCSITNNGRSRCTNNLCSRLENDCLEKDHLSKIYPNRIMTMKYEDLAKQPIETSQKMYDFIGIPMTSEVRQIIYNKTMAGSKNDCSICSTRSNSSAHIDLWKNRIDSDFLDIINTRCDAVIKRFHYD